MDSKKSLFEIVFQQGENQRVLIGLQNNGFEPLYIKNVTGAFVEESEHGETLSYAQNFTIDSLGGAIVSQHETLSIAYEFFPFTSIQAKNYKLIIAVFYADNRFEYTSVVFNGHVKVTENDQDVGITGVFSLLLTCAFVFLFGFIIYVKVQDRFGAQDDGKKRRGQQTGFLGTLRSIISSQ